MVLAMLKKGLLCRPRELQGSTKCRGHFLIMGLVVQASLAAEQQHMALAMQACCAGLGKLQGSTKYRGHFLSMGLVVLASFAAEQQIMALAMLKTGLLCKHGGQACCAGLGELQDSTKYGSTSSSWGMGLVVQASLAAGQQNMAVAMFKRGLLIRSRGAAGQGLQPLLMKGAKFKKNTNSGHPKICLALFGNHLVPNFGTTVWPIDIIYLTLLMWARSCHCT